MSVCTTIAARLYPYILHTSCTYVFMYILYRLPIHYNRGYMYNYSSYTTLYILNYICVYVHVQIAYTLIEGTNDNILGRNEPSLLTSISVTATGQTFTGLTPNSTYEVVICAVTKAGCGANVTRYQTTNEDGKTVQQAIADILMVFIYVCIFCTFAIAEIMSIIWYTKHKSLCGRCAIGIVNIVNNMIMFVDRKCTTSDNNHYPIYRLTCILSSSQYYICLLHLV